MFFSETIVLENVEFDTFLSIRASLVGRPNVTQENCDRIKVLHGKELVNATQDLCNGSVLHVLWKGFHKDGRNLIHYDVLIGNQTYVFHHSLAMLNRVLSHIG